jgi:hypothetical protein
LEQIYKTKLAIEILFEFIEFLIFFWFHGILVLVRRYGELSNVNHMEVSMKLNIFALIALLTFVGSAVVETQLNAGCKGGRCALAATASKKSSGCKNGRCSRSKPSKPVQPTKPRGCKNGRCGR